MALAENRRAYFDYKIHKEYEAGIELFGFEVKAVRSGKMDLSGSYAVPRSGEAFLINSKIQPYQSKNAPPEYNPERSRRLLLHKKEIIEIFDKINRGLTLLPLRVYDKKGKIKILLGLGRRIKKGDKREKIKKKEDIRKIKKLVA